MKKLVLSLKARTPLRVRALPLLLGTMSVCSLVPAVALAAPPVNEAKPGSQLSPNLTGPPSPIDFLGGSVRARLHLAGYDDPGLIGAIIAFMRQKERARAPLLKTADTLSEALATPNFDEKKLADLCDLFRAEVDEERDRSERAEKELDTQIKWSVNKRLTATLTLAGIVGDAGEFLSSAASEIDSEEVTAPEVEAKDTK